MASNYTHETLFKIPPLQFKRQTDGRYVAHTPFGVIDIYRRIEPEPGEPKWAWGYEFQEYYDSASFPVATLAAGKQAANTFWIDRLSRALEVQP